jgi:Raf kinase inhibitor-like YbhB/YbcL family protein
MKITSPAFENNQEIPEKYTCQGENINPPLELGEVPANAQSMVLIVDDPDAPAGTWTHWVVYNIPKDTEKIESGIKPPGIEAVTSFGKPGFSGPCPPSGTHRYFFKVFALDNLFRIGNDSNRTTVEAAMQNHILSSGELVGLYQKR